MPLPSALRQRLTPRRKRQALYLLAAALLYSVLGFLLLPHLIEKELKSFVADRLKLDATVGAVGFNPWAMSLRIDQLRVAEPHGGETLVSASRFYIRVGVLASAWLRGASVSELDLVDPYVNAHIRKDGKLNLLQLVPPASPEPQPKPESKTAVRWRIGKLGLHDGHIDFQDETRPTPFSTRFTPLNISLENLSSLPNKKGEYALAAATGHGEQLRWHGTVALSPLRSKGHLEIGNLQATTPWSYVQDSVPVIVRSGTVDVAGDYDLTVDQGATVRLNQGSVNVHRLLVEQKADKDPLWFMLDGLNLGGLQLDWPLHAAAVDTLALNGFAILGRQNTEPLVKFDKFALSNIGWQAGSGTASLGRLELDQLGLRTDAGEHLFDLPGLVVSDVSAQPASRTLRVNAIALRDGDASVRILPGMQVDWQTTLAGLARRLTAMAAPPPAIAGREPGRKPVAKTAAAKPAAPPWTVSLGAFDLSGFRIEAEDHRFAVPVKIPLRDIAVRIKPRQAPEQPHQIDAGLTLGNGGTLAVQGTFSEAPVSTDVKLTLDALNLPPLAPYFADIGRFKLLSGKLDVDGRLRFAQGKSTQLSFDGRVATSKFAANDLDINQRFLAWNQIAADGIHFNLAPMQVTVRQVMADQLYTRLIVTPDYKLNVQHIFATAETNTARKTPPAPTKPADDTAAPAVPVNVGTLLIKDSSMLFADLTLKPQFATGIQALNGSIKNISTNKSVRSSVNLSGRVDEAGTAQITGELNPLASDAYTDLSVKFGNLEMTNFTPYSAKFAGYRIEKGKLSLDLSYKIRNRQLDASNSVVVNQLTLGDKVQSPDALNLPLKLAVAILKDENGVINIDLPVSGSLDDPKFKVGPLLWQAFVNVLTKVATAPFKFIAGLAGGGEDMDNIAFATGDSGLPASEAEKLDKLAGIMKKKPGLELELRGAYDPAADLQALRMLHFNKEYEALAAEGGKEESILEGLYTQRIGKEQLAELRALNLKPPAENDPNARQTLALSKQNYIRAMRNDLAAREPVNEGDLRQLALNRARAIQSQVVDHDQVDASRVFVLDPQPATARDDQVVTVMTLNAQ